MRISKLYCDCCGKETNKKLNIRGEGITIDYVELCDSCVKEYDAAVNKFRTDISYKFTVGRRKHYVADGDGGFHYDFD